MFKKLFSCVFKKKQEKDTIDDRALEVINRTKKASASTVTRVQYVVDNETVRSLNPTTKRRISSSTTNDSSSSSHPRRQSDVVSYSQRQINISGGGGGSSNKSCSDSDDTYNPSSDVVRYQLRNRQLMAQGSIDNGVYKYMQFASGGGYETPRPSFTLLHTDNNASTAAAAAAATAAIVTEANTRSDSCKDNVSQTEESIVYTGSSCASDCSSSSSSSDSSLQRLSRNNSYDRNTLSLPSSPSPSSPKSVSSNSPLLPALPLPDNTATTASAKYNRQSKIIHDLGLYSSQAMDKSSSAYIIVDNWQNEIPSKDRSGIDTVINTA